jgi:MFS family permease
LIGTTIEFFDFYIYATAAVAFFARPVGSVLFGHFGDRVGRKVTLVAALLTMGVSTVVIGLLPTYESIGVAAPLLLASCRFGQGLGLGGEWGGAVLLAVENAPPHRRAWYSMFPQLGAPLGFLCSGGIFLLLSERLTDDQVFRFGWRIPFLASALLVLLGLYVRLAITETPVFADSISRRERVPVPMLVVCREHPAPTGRSDCERWMPGIGGSERPGRAWLRWIDGNRRGALAGVRMGPHMGGRLTAHDDSCEVGVR